MYLNNIRNVFNNVLNNREHCFFHLQAVQQLKIVLLRIIQITSFKCSQYIVALFKNYPFSITTTAPSKEKYENIQLQ